MLRVFLPPEPEGLQVDDNQIIADYTRENCDCRGPRENKCRRKPRPVVFLNKDSGVEIVYMCRLSTLELFVDEDTAFIFDNGGWKPLK